MNGIGVLGNYLLRVQFGGVDVKITPESIGSIDIIEYIDKFLPSLNMVFRDSTGFLTHMLPIDNNYNKVTVTFANQTDLTQIKLMRFKLYRRHPESVNEESCTISMSGLLDTTNMFSPNYVRGWAFTSIKNIIGNIGNNDLGINYFDIEPGLDANVNIVQPNWTNAQFLNYLSDRVMASSKNVGHFVFVDSPANDTDANKTVEVFQNKYSIGEAKSRLNFRSIQSLITQPIVYSFIADTKPYHDCLPIYNYELIDNYEALGIMGVEQQSYGNYDFTNGVFNRNEVVLDDIDYSLSEYYMHSDANETQGLSQEFLGRTTEFMPDYKRMARAKYLKKVNSLSMIWINVPGIPKINCGNIVKIVFLRGASSADIPFSYQYSGFWMVKRIVHHFADTYITRLLLSRPGIDYAGDTKFVKAKNWRKS